MNINLTLIIQSINFLIAYIMLDRLLFNPVIALLNKEKQLKNTLISEIETEKKKKEAKLAYKENKWHKFQTYFSKNSPDVFEGIFKCIKPPDVLRLDKISEDQTKSIAKIIENILEKKVMDVN